MLYIKIDGSKVESMSYNFIPGAIAQDSPNNSLLYEAGPECAYVVATPVEESREVTVPSDMMDPESPETTTTIKFTDKVKVDPAKLEAKLKMAKLQEMKAETFWNIQAGFVSEALGAPHTYESETRDQLNLVCALSFVQATNSDIDYVCIDANGVKAPRTHTPAQMMQVMKDGNEKLANGIKAFYNAAPTVSVDLPPELV